MGETIEWQRLDFNQLLRVYEGLRSESR